MNPSTMPGLNHCQSYNYNSVVRFFWKLFLFLLLTTEPSSALRFKFPLPLCSDYAPFLPPYHNHSNNLYHLLSSSHDTKWWNATASAGSAWWNQTATCLRQSTHSLWQSTKNTTQEAYAKLRQHHDALMASSTSSSDPPARSAGLSASSNDSLSSSHRLVAHRHHSQNETSLTEYLAKLERRLEIMEQERLGSHQELVRQQRELSALQRLQAQHHQEMWMATAVALAPKKVPLALQILHIAWVTTLSVVLWGSLVGITLVALTHILGFVLQWTTPWMDRLVEQWHVFVVASARGIARWVGGGGDGNIQHGIPSALVAMAPTTPAM